MECSWLKQRAETRARERASDRIYCKSLKPICRPRELASLWGKAWAGLTWTSHEARQPNRLDVHNCTELQTLRALPATLGTMTSGTNGGQAITAATLRDLDKSQERGVLPCSSVLLECCRTEGISALFSLPPCQMCLQSAVPRPAPNGCVAMCVAGAVATWQGHWQRGVPCWKAKQPTATVSPDERAAG